MYYKFFIEKDQCVDREENDQREGKKKNMNEENGNLNLICKQWINHV